MQLVCFSNSTYVAKITKKTISALANVASKYKNQYACSKHQIQYYNKNFLTQIFADCIIVHEVI